jgi:hypothetical protein
MYGIRGLELLRKKVPAPKALHRLLGEDITIAATRSYLDWKIDMMKTIFRFMLSLTVLAFAGLPPAVVLTGAEPTAPDPSKFAQVVEEPDSWKITPAGYDVHTDKDLNVLAPPAGQTLYLESAAAKAAPCEFVVSFRLKPAKGAASLSLQMGCAGQQALTLGVNTAAGQKYVGYGASVTGGKTPPQPMSGYLYFEAVTERSLAWTEEMRRAIEAQMASAPKIEESILTLRCTVQKGLFRSWLNGRFVTELILEPDMDPSGLVKITSYAGVELIHVGAVRPFTPPPARFEPVGIGGNLNSGLLDGKKVDRLTVPGIQSHSGFKANSNAPNWHGAAVLDGVPFELPEEDARGNDHIDVSTSWTRFGALPGYFMAHVGAFARWVSADRIDPARICFYIPKGKYKALHLIAVADGRKDSVPVVTAQFYRPDAGHPFNFEGTVPTLKGDAGEAKPVEVKLANGRKTRLYHVVIPLDPDAFSWFTDLPRTAMEITKQVQYYRAYPDTLEYSWHGAGLPSSVQIYAMTLERVAVDVDLEPENFGHFWTAPAQPNYTVQLRNTTGTATTAKLAISTRSDDGLDTTKQEQTVPLPADGATAKAPVTLKPTRYGMQEMTVAVTTGDETTTWRRKFAFLHPDTRDKDLWEAGRGSLFGFWAPGGAHDTPPLEKELPLMAAAGAETSLADYDRAKPEVKAMAEKYRFINESAFYGGMFYCNAFVSPPELVKKYDPTKPEETGKALVDAIRPYKSQPSALCRPIYLPFWPEPLIGPITGGVWPTHYGVDYQLNPEEQKLFEDREQMFLIGARAVRKEWPDVKILLPYGDPNYTAMFLRLSPKSREFIDGCAVDLPGFERLPEQQPHQVSFSRLWAIMKDIKQYKPDPYMVVVEGTSISSKDIDTGEQEQADVATRGFLLLIGYGITRFESADCPFDPANYWGENHYGGGWCNRKPVATPKLAYINYATLTRHINRANFTKYLPTGSTSTYCQQFKHYKTGKLIHVLWTIRGKRTVNVKVAPGTSLELYDQHDNPTALKEKDGNVTFKVNNTPQYLEGLTADAQITLGESDHSDAKPGEASRKLGNLTSWKLVEKEDLDYAKNKPFHIERFLAKMTAQKMEAPKAQGGKALAIHLEKQEKDRGVMPFYTTLEPDDPIRIPGKATHLGLWVRASSDWGRVVYEVRDAKGEKWISVGTKEDWNCDDIHGWSMFCFDGWRYLRFELPSSAPYDSYREYGTSWWGSYGGDGVIDLPLKLEKIIVERRPKVIWGNELVDASSDDVLLGDLYAEYASKADQGDEVIRLSKIRMPIPKNLPELGNPIAELAKTGVGAPTKVLNVTDPAHQYDGTRCHVHFDTVAGAKGYNVWVSPYPDGRGALQLGAGWTESGKLIEGLRPEIEFYVFVVYTDKDGKLSKPSEPLKIALKDRFGYK